jgi:hypothetical protein
MGIAVEPDEWEVAEENRPLMEKGMNPVRQAAEGLAAPGCKPTHLFASPFVRSTIRRGCCVRSSQEGRRGAGRVRGRHQPGRGAVVLVASADATTELREASPCQKRAGQS